MMNRIMASTAFGGFTGMFVILGLELSGTFWFAVPFGLIAGPCVALMACRPTEPGGKWLWEKRE